MSKKEILAWCFLFIPTTTVLPIVLRIAPDSLLAFIVVWVWLILFIYGVKLVAES